MIEKLKKDLTRTKEEMEQLKSDNRTLFDEHIALQVKIIFIVFDKLN